MREQPKKKKITYERYWERKNVYFELENSSNNLDICEIKHGFVTIFLNGF